MSSFTVALRYLISGRSFASAKHARHYDDKEPTDARRGEALLTRRR